MSTPAAAWVCCQLGAREHYAVPRALHRRGLLAGLVTDAWMPPGALTGRLIAPALTRLAQRYHGDLAVAPVRALTPSLIAHEAWWRAQGRRDWDLVSRRNLWFQNRAAAALPERRAPTILFAHSYAAEAILRDGKQRGWTTVLGQIDPGPEHYALQQRMASARPEYTSQLAAPPPGYFERWRIECELADAIVVNSEWSRESIVRAGVDARKIAMVPLAYEPEAGSAAFERRYPDAFSSERPLRVLFVGTATVAKGVPELLQALELLADLPLELRMVGDRAMTIPARLEAHPRITWVGPVDRTAVMEYYRSSDLLAFPSHSDGFGMAQVEAQGWALPIVASRHCGAVVQNDHTGILLDEVSPAAIGSAIRQLAGSADLLRRFSANARRSQPVSLNALADGLTAIVPA